jgi:hypothetical protein
VKTDDLNFMLMGGIAVACFVAGLFFLRYWFSTRDRFFLFFTLSFWIEAVNRVVMVATGSWNESAPLHYLVRLLAYALIVIAIWDKNRPGSR